jgi:hypothetical protein
MGPGPPAWPMTLPSFKGGPRKKKEVIESAWVPSKES